MTKWHTPIEIPGDPTVPLGVTPKQYVDNGLALKAPLLSPALTGVPTAPTAEADTATGQLATTLYVTSQAGTANPLMNGTVAVGVSLRYARQDHVHPSDSTKLNVSAYTAADVLAKLLTVDGASSGLDADLLDGQQGSYYTNLNNMSGTLDAARLPAFSGDISTSAGSSVTSIGANKVTLTHLAQISTASFLGRSTAGTGNVEVLSVAQAKTLLALTKADVGLGNVDNTSDLNKPVSTAQQTALNLKANLASPDFSGTPTAPTAIPGTNTTQLATTEFVTAAVAAAMASGAMTWLEINNANVNPAVNNTGYLMQCGGVDRTVTLPASAPQYFRVTINANGGDVILQPNGNNIDGVGVGNTLRIEDGNTVTLVAHATGLLDILYGAVPGPQGLPGEGGGAGHFGTAEIDFGGGAGSNEASVAITGQTGILSNSNVLVSIRAVATSDHSVQDHTYAAMLIGLAAGPTTAGVGFTIYARSREPLVGKFNVNWTWG